jgi:prophage endopeptidase
VIWLTAAWAIAKRVFGFMPLKDWLIAGALAAILGYHLYTVHEARKAGFDEGFAEATEQCEARERAAKADYDKRVLALQQQKREAEQEQAAQLAIAGANYEKDLQDAQDQRKRDLAAAQSGAIKLRVAGLCPRAPDTSTSPETSTATAERDGAAGGELPAALTGRLLELADDANEVVRQLGACQAVVNTYLKGQT